jgi:hypothetical protein
MTNPRTLRSFALGMLLAPALTAQHAEDKAQAEAMLKSAEDVAQQVADLLGRPFKTPVAKSVMTKAELRKEVAAMVAKDFGGGKIERTEAWLRAMGLLVSDRNLEQTMTDVLLSQIGGFYDPERKAFFMMVESAAYGDVINRMMIAHELCHALDDQYVDLERLQRPPGTTPTEDETYAIGCVVEGSATALMFHWLARAVQDGAKLDDLAKMAEQQKDQMAVLLDAPPYCTLLAANYLVGHNFMTKGEGFTGLAPASGNDGNVILEVAKAMPRSSEQVLHPDKYWDAAARDEPVVLTSGDEVAALLERETGHKVIERNTLGELVTALVTSPQQRRLNATLMIRADYWTNRAARGWGGDRLFLLAKGQVDAGQPVEDAGVVWVTAWDSTEDRQEFVKAVQRHRGEQPGFAITADGKVAVLAFGSARALGDDGLAAVLATCRFEQDGSPWSK